MARTALRGWPFRRDRQQSRPESLTSMVSTLGDGVSAGTVEQASAAASWSSRPPGTTFPRLTDLTRPGGGLDFMFPTVLDERVTIDRRHHRRDVHCKQARPGSAVNPTVIGDRDRTIVAAVGRLWMLHQRQQLCRRFRSSLARSG